MKSLGLESDPLGKLFIYTWKNKGLKINPGRTHALMRDHLEENSSLMSVAKKRVY